jgi:hypothetical protein
VIKHTLTKKQQLVLCAMYVERLADNPQAFLSCSPSRKGLLCIQPSDLYVSVGLIRYLQSLGLVGDEDRGIYALTPDGEELAKALFKVLS